MEQAPSVATVTVGEEHTFSVLLVIVLDKYKDEDKISTWYRFALL